MKIVLNPNEQIEIEFAESDGSIIVEFNQDFLEVRTDWADTQGRVGSIYKEEFGTPDLDDSVPV